MLAGMCERACIRGNVRHELAVAIPGGKCVQQAANVYLIAGEVAADGMSINGKAHVTVPV